MADLEETIISDAKQLLEEDGGRDRNRVVPVFTVIKNNAILKNIFLLQAPPSSETHESDKRSQSGVDEYCYDREERDEILTVGRHPDCSIVLNHPSISRVHLQIWSRPSARKLAVNDLSSVHGTWVREEKLEPGVLVELNEGDEMRVGGSSRVYKLHWVPESQAYDLDHPYYPASDVMMCDDMEKQEEEVLEDVSDLMAEKVEDSVVSSAEEVCPERSVRRDSVMKGILKHRSPLGMIEPVRFALMHAEMVASADFREVEKAPSADTDNWEDVMDMPSTPNKDKQEEEMFQDVSGLMAEKVEDSDCKVVDLVACGEAEEVCHDRTVSNDSGTEGILRDRSPLGSTDQERFVLPHGDMVVLADFTEVEEAPSAVTDNLEDVSEISTLNKEKHGEEVYQDASSLMAENIENLDSEVVDLMISVSGKEEIRLDRTSRNNSVVEGILKQRPPLGVMEQESSVLQHGQMVASADFREWEISDTCDMSIWKFRSVNVDNGEDVIEIPTPDKQKFISDPPLFKSMKRIGVLDENSYISDISIRPFYKSNSKISDIIMDDESDAYTPDKENMTPNTRLLKAKMKKMGKLDQNERNSSMSCRLNSSVDPISPFRADQDPRGASNKKILTLSVPPQKSTRALSTLADTDGTDKQMNAVQRKEEPVMLQSAYVMCSLKCDSDASVHNAAARIGKILSGAQPVGLRISSETEVRANWYMVVDSSCLLDHKSRRALQLLRGLKGTRLLVPIKVVRELECLERGSFCQRATKVSAGPFSVARKVEVLQQRAEFFQRAKEVSAALKWIKDCMVNTAWWIHVQTPRSLEDMLPTATASHGRCYSSNMFETTCWRMFPTSKRFKNVPRPRSEDHVFECAFQNIRSITADKGEIVILSNDVKTKAMTKGFICETATEFRNSLVKPLSERFLQPESAPRGRTGSYAIDVLLEPLEERFYSRHLKKPLMRQQRSARGLQLLLLP